MTKTLRTWLFPREEQRMTSELQIKLLRRTHMTLEQGEHQREKNLTGQNLTLELDKLRIQILVTITTNTNAPRIIYTSEVPFRKPLGNNQPNLQSHSTHKCFFALVTWNSRSKQKTNGNFLKKEAGTAIGDPSQIQSFSPSHLQLLLRLQIN